MIGNARQHVSEPGAWIDIIQFGGADQRIYGSGPFAATCHWACNSPWKWALKIP
jgi:hypothetical protein